MSVGPVPNGLDPLVLGPLAAGALVALATLDLLIVEPPVVGGQHHLNVVNLAILAAAVCIAGSLNYA